MSPLILVVEDEPALATLLRYNLEKEGFSVAEAHDGEEALLQLSERTPDAVLLDWMLPQVSGLEICRRSTAIGCRSARSLSAKPSMSCSSWSTRASASTTSAASRLSRFTTASMALASWVSASPPIWVMALSSRRSSSS